jgi:hypothetical protein
MTFPLLCALHLVYGVAMAFAVFRRMRADGDVLGVPLLFTLLPVGAVSAPAAALLLRFSGAWFLHGALHEDRAILYERFHLGLMFAVGLAAGVCVVVGMFFALAFLTRDRPREAAAPIAFAVIVAALVLLFDGADVLRVGATPLYRHPVALVSIVDVVALVLAWRYARKRLSAPIRVR